MSHLKDQLTAFRSSVVQSSSKIANKRSVGAPTNAVPSPSPAPTKQPVQIDLKRKRPDPSAFSQPADTGTGKHIRTQIHYAIENLKEKGRPQTLTDITAYLNIHNEPEQHKKNIGRILRAHEKVQYDPRNDGGEGTYSYRPIHNIRTAQDLLGFLQSQATALGLQVKEMKDGWPGAEAAIDDLEGQGKLLVTRNKKDNHAKMVWLDDPSLRFPVDDEFQILWHRIKLPEPGALADELEKAGMQPANKSRGLKVKVVEPQKKTKKARRGGKTTNTHMENVLRDYSHLKK